MDKEKIIEMAGDPRLISGIHNYCDKWCERCAFTRRCAVFAMEEADPSVPSGNAEEDSQADLRKVSEIFSTTFEMLLDMAKEAGIDLEELASEADLAAEEAEEEKTREHPLVEESRSYMLTVHDWLKSLRQLAECLERESRPEDQDEATPDTALVGDAVDAADLRDAVQILSWYHTVIPAKLWRAVRGIQPDRLDELTRDSDGSAKVALICIERSMVAWWRLLGGLPEEKRAISGFLARLNRLQQAAERTFPEAWNFVRPGFDERDIEKSESGSR